jgi:hypothetical protein
MRKKLNTLGQTVNETMTLRELKAEPVLGNILKHKFNMLRELIQGRLLKLLTIMTMAVFWNVIPCSLVHVSENLTVSVTRVTGE